MSFLAEIKTFIKTEIFGIEETNTKENSLQKHSKNTPIIECKTEEPVDILEKNLSNTELSSDKQNSITQKAVEETIENIPAKTVNLKQMIKNGLIEKVTGLSKENFEKLTQKQKLITFKSIQASVKKYEYLKQEGKISNDANIEEVIIANASDIYKAIASGAFKDEAEYENFTTNINKELGKDFSKLSKLERRDEFKRCKLELKEAFDKQLEEIQKLPEGERFAATQKLLLRQKFIARKYFIEVAAVQNSETAADAMLLLKAEDIEYGAKTLMQTRCSDQERTSVADYVDYSFTKEIIKTNSTFGEKVSSEKLKGYTETFMQYKSVDAAYEYQNAYKEDRKIYEKALNKQRNGEALTEEEKTLLSYMESDYYTATAQGIGQGALKNINMTNEQKAQFIATWDNDAKQFSDYEKVTTNVKKYIEENPEYKDIKEILKKSSTYNKKSITTKDESSKKLEQELKFETQSSPTTNDNKIHYNKEITTNPTTTKNTKKIVSKPSSTNIITSSNPIEITQCIRKEGLEESIREYGSDAISLILDSSSLKHLRPRITTIIRSYDLNSLIGITQNCSDSSFVYICSIVNDDYVEKLKEVRENTKGLCYAAEKQVKNLEGKNELI